jgi:hypothetical protein
VRQDTAHNILARISDEQHAEHQGKEGADESAVNEALGRRSKARAASARVR